jgi:hypothetical protein
VRRAAKLKTLFIMVSAAASGAMLRRILARFAGPRGVVLDLPHVVGAIPPAELIGGRISVVEGSFFEAVPAGADIVTCWSEYCTTGPTMTAGESFAPAARRWVGMRYF